jgi:hypothetical protein
MYMMANAAVFPTYAMNTIVVVECVQLSMLCERSGSVAHKFPPNHLDGITTFIGVQDSASVWPSRRRLQVSGSLVSPSGFSSSLHR